jgi:hypothetical protein
MELPRYEAPSLMEAISPSAEFDPMDEVLEDPEEFQPMHSESSGSEWRGISEEAQDIEG